MKASYVIPNYNTAAWLPHAVRSCLDQTHKDIEVVVVDDCSTDSSKEYLEWIKKQDKRVKVIYNEVNKGRSASRNIGNNAATGDVIFVCDSDDLAVLNRTELTLKKIKAGFQMVYGSAVVMDALGNALHEISAKPLDIKEAFTKMENGLVHSSVAYTKEIALKYPYEGGDICRLGLDDYHQQVRMMKDGVKMGFIPDVICAYRVLESGITSQRNPQEVLDLKKKIMGAK